MVQIEQITYNPFQENMVLVYDETKECIIIDPGCYFKEEEEDLKNRIARLGLTPVKAILTHSHLDHVFGLQFVKNEYDIPVFIHEQDQQTLDLFDKTVQLYQIPNTKTPPQPDGYLKEGTSIKFGNSSLEVIFVPGHAPGHIAFVHGEANFVVNGDCLFREGIGRTDLPGGDHNTLINSIRNELFSLPENMVVYCGHGPTTTIGYEKENNPFLK